VNQYDLSAVLPLLEKAVYWRDETMSGNTQERYTLDTRVGALDVVLAQPSDLEGVLSILEEARQWLLAKGIPEQWPRPHPPEAIAWRIECRETYLAYHHGQAIATFTLQGSDVQTWGDLPGEAMYVHGLAVRRAFAGQQIGEQLLQLAAEICTAMGKPYLRLDCWAGNTTLSQYYERVGFERCGAREWPTSGDTPPWRVNLFERRLRR
jgi:ribosomal protein S18 acetylase RimI-like enzyme